jgi:hypothetical protein
LNGCFGILKYVLSVNGKERKWLGLLGLFVCGWNWSGYFTVDRSFSCTFSYNTEFCGGHVRAASECVAAFFAFPDAYAFAFHPLETALWASVGFFKSRGCSDVPFSDCGPVSGA